MKIGLLWYSRELPRWKRILRAATVYARKYGGQPNCCHLSTKDPCLDDTELEELAGIEIVYSNTIDTDHLWIGLKGDLRTELRPVEIEI